ncbi:hypothetical protein [Streptomyces sp. NBC_01431]|uniref:hypothetical protein n=1 Tax=Streptomyces sp. NBC_01431 TaxID=2903863 RepID=UPI002E3334F1|nr:hypothetical protein [Streptomyces sp. NBC_01431]
MSPSTCSTNAALGPRSFSQYNGLTDSSIAIPRPPTARSAVRRLYRLCSCTQTVPQTGHACGPPAFAQ